MKRLIMLFVLSFTLIAGGCSQATQQSGDSKPAEQPKSDFPNKPIEIIVPLGSGGSSDLLARVMADAVQKYLPNNQPVVVVNKPGGAGAIGSTEVFQAKPDGYKLLFTSSAIISTTPHFGKTIYTHDSFQPIMKMAANPLLFVVKADAPWKTYEEWVDYAKNNPDKFSYATTAVGGLYQISMEGLKAATGIKSKIVPFEKGSEEINALLGGHVPGGILNNVEVKPHLESKALRVLLNMGNRKQDWYKDAPTAKEKGIEVLGELSSGLLAPKGVPQDVLDILHDSFKKAYEDPAVVEQLNKMGMVTTYAGPEEFQKELTDSFNKSGVILKQIGLIK
ncbi:tripartite-type tricarboxylate transporter receptor subunit TctC [Neobacillus niacini]|uniref:tripartite tricarboxylate transporter substrate binding protein n=1 Tax=Neobacillus niacini TaxID=86668 RepID=UPI0028645CF0|nr:tripartite tricarboxylate transporter substrate binding protein [Neobacillus niacini]MDR7076064.1 tripartite-type tricarboxylate transporter receptor subunit TctC [Neobacillus niacini]